MKRKILAKLKGKYYLNEFESLTHLREAAEEILAENVERRRELWTELKTEYNITHRDPIILDRKKNIVYVEE